MGGRDPSGFQAEEIAQEIGSECPAVQQAENALGGLAAQSFHAAEGALERAGEALKDAAAKALEDLGPAAEARNWQGTEQYPGVDNWLNGVLSKGTQVAGGVPGQSNFYFPPAAVEEADRDASTLFQGLQVAPHRDFGYRPGVTVYEVPNDLMAAFSNASANTQFGAGGTPQYYIPNSAQSLTPLFSIPLKR